VSLAVLPVPARDVVDVGRVARPSIVVPLEAAAVDVGIARRTLLLDRSGFLVAPRRTSMTLRTRMPATRVALLGFGERLFVDVPRRYRRLGLVRARLEGWLGELTILPRTVWVHEIVHRYVFEREALGTRDNLATHFLETEILKEVYFLFRDRDDEGAERETMGQRHSAPVERAIALIEADLFGDIDVKRLARRCGASESTLLRSFRRELDVTPGAYWRMRRLDEAMVLLRAGRYSIAEIAVRTGYEKSTSFGLAFRKRFRSPPSAFLRRRPTKRAP